MKILPSSLAILAACILPSFGQTIVLNNTNSSDAFVDSRNPTTNFGGEAYLIAGHADHNLSQNVFTYIQFDLLGLPSEASSVTINLRRVGGDGDSGYPVSVYVVTSEWTETGITFNSQPSIQAVPFTSTVVNAAGSFYAFDITSIYNDWAANNLDNFGLVFKTSATEPPNGESYDFRSSEGPEELRPYLQIATIPEPATCLMLALGAGFIVLPRRKRLA